MAAAIVRRRGTGSPDPRQPRMDQNPLRPRGTFSPGPRIMSSGVRGGCQGSAASRDGGGVVASILFIPGLRRHTVGAGGTAVDARREARLWAGLAGDHGWLATRVAYP